MATHIIKYTYKQINIDKFKSTKHFELIDVENGKQKLSGFLNISENRDFANSSPKYWVKERQNNKWVKPSLTGLFSTSMPNLYRGDKDKRSHLLLFKFIDNKKTLVVYYFENHFTRDLSGIWGQIGK